VVKEAFLLSFLSAGAFPVQNTIHFCREEVMSELKFSTGFIETATGHIPVVTADLGWRDRLGAFRVRWRIGRNRYSIPPGLYALGSPDSDSEVLVTANYKLSFDKLRQALPGRDFWIAVLDTNGINVWCAAGKGTFGTEELVRRIGEIRLNEIVNHKRLIVPQLGAPGVAAHQVKKESGFKVVYGPIRAVDLPAFLEAGMKATEQMRRVTFSVGERMAVAPVEVVGAVRVMILVIPSFFFLSGLFGPFDYWANTSYSGSLALAALITAFIGGTLIFPLLLPWLPGRAFSLKGLSVGLIAAVTAITGFGHGWAGWPQVAESLSWVLMVTAMTSYLAMNFTGASTYTSLSGVKREMRVAVPLQISGAAAGLILWIIAGIAA
jgi:acetyl-CoA decarbonylase/synthase complex subunit gamma